MTVLRSLAILAGSVLLFTCACYILGFGISILCFAPGHPADKIFWGLLPAVAGAGLVAIAWRNWRRLYRRRWLAWLIGLGLVFPAAVVADLMLLMKIRQYGPDSPANWDADRRVFDWGQGSVRIPAGFTHVKLHGIDTVMGQFVSGDGTMEIHYDIGSLAGEHGGIARQRTSLVSGARVSRAHGTYRDEEGQAGAVSVVSFPDTGCANFFAYSSTRDASPPIDAIAASYQPHSRLTWIYPLLPEVLRTDCRYRFHLPWPY